MNRNDIKSLLETLTEKIDAIADEEVKSIQKTLLNLVEFLMAENDTLREEIQKLRDENNRLKGEQGQPSIRKQSSDHSSEKDRKPRGQQPKKKKPKKKKHKIKIDRVQICEIDKSQLPADAKFKGYQPVVVQDIEIKTDNIEFKKQIYYSPSLNKTFIAELPTGYRGEFGPRIKALIIDLHHNNKMTESAIHGFLTNHGMMISQATISRVLTENHDEFHREKHDIVQAGLASSTHQQMDDTGARVNGKNHYTHILCNDLYTAYFTRRHKDRLTLIDILTPGDMMFQFNESSYALMEHMHLPPKQLTRLRSCVKQEIINRAEVDTLLNGLFPNPKKCINSRRVILEASAIIAYQQLPHAVEILLTDDAPQFKQITELLALCWVHDGRHYKKLTPVIPRHQTQLDNFLSQYWDFYHQLLDYKKQPTAALVRSLDKEFDALFSTQTGYDQLDERINKTRDKKDSLLLVLKHPSLPLHNNGSELGARTQARYRDISLHTINEKGTQAKDTFMTLVETAKKLTVNSYRYFYDRIANTYEMPSLANLIDNNAQMATPTYDTG